jgi:hypothetical protein
MMEAITVVLIGAALVALAAVVARGMWVMWRGTMIEERPLLMHRMLKRQGVTIAGVEDYLTLERACRAARRCAACRDAEACKAWLDRGNGERYDTFCPNAEFIEQLKQKQAQAA